MADLLDREELLNNRPEYLNPQMEDEIQSARHKGWNDCNSYYYHLITKQPTVETVKHAHWIENKYCGYYSCSNCGGVGTANGMSPIEDCHLNYCPYCGAKMDEVTDKDMKEKEQRNMNIMLDSTALMPKRGHATDAGLDLLSPVDTVIPAHGAVTVDTGVHIELPAHTAGFLKSKSGLNVKYGITSEGVIDVGYTGSIAVKLYNHSGMDYKVSRGDKISQLVVIKIDTPELVLVDKLTDTERGNGGFGSTGR